MTAMPAIAVKPASVEIEEYFARSGSHFSNRDAKIIGPELVRLGREGRTTAEDILEAATPEGAALHPFINWDEQASIQRDRLWQARQLGNSIMVRIVDERGEKQEIRAFHAVTVVHEDTDEEPVLKEYKSIEVIRADEALAKQVIREAFQQLRGWRKRYSQYSEVFGPVFEVIDSLQIEMDGLR